MTPATLLAEAAKADASADAIFAAMDAAGTPDRFGARPIIPAGFEAQAERASDLRRRARCLREEAEEIARASATPPTAKAPAAAPLAARAPIPESTAPAPAPVFPGAAGVVDTVEIVARRILNSDIPDSAVPEVALAPVVGPGTAEDPVSRIAERILQA